MRIASDVASCGSEIEQVNIEQYELNFASLSAFARVENSIALYSRRLRLHFVVCSLFFIVISGDK